MIPTGSAGWTHAAAACREARPAPAHRKHLLRIPEQIHNPGFEAVPLCKDELGEISSGIVPGKIRVAHEPTLVAVEVQPIDQGVAEYEAASARCRHPT